jgi:hypothetical protein
LFTDCLTVRQLSLRLGIPEHAVRALYRARLLKFFRIGFTVMFRLKDVEQYERDRAAEETERAAEIARAQAIADRTGEVTEVRRRG